MSFKIQFGSTVWDFPSALFGDSLTLEFQQSLTHTHFNGGLTGQYKLPWRKCFEGQWHRLLEIVGERVKVTIIEPVWNCERDLWEDKLLHQWHVYITDESSLSHESFDIVFMVDSHDQREQELITRSGQSYNADRASTISLADDILSRS